MASYAAQISALQGQINALNTQINRINESCESLQDFKAVVEKSQMDYQSCMSAKKSTLSQVLPYCVNTKCNTEYEEGMDTRLNGVGAASVSATYVAFLGAIIIKIALYKAQVASLNAMIQRHNTSISNLREQERLEQERLERERLERESQAQNTQ